MFSLRVFVAENKKFFLFFGNFERIKLRSFSKSVCNILSASSITKQNFILDEIKNLYGGNIGMAGFNKLPPGHSMPYHRDQIDGSYPFSPYYKVLRRYHIPLFTNDQAYIKVGREVKNMKVGECWEFNNNLFHEVWNDGDTDRIHFVFDVLPYKWL